MTARREGVRVAIAIDTSPGIAGGIVQSTQGLVMSLGELDGPEQYVLAARTAAQAEWISRFRGPNQQIVVRDPRWRGPVDGGFLKRTLRPLVEDIRGIVGRLVPQTRWSSLPVSNGYYESLQCDVLHFPTQGFTLCALPTVYNPHDLQYLHYPQFFTPDELARRETTYRAACQLSHTIAVGSAWIKRDVVRQYAVGPEKIQIIPWGSPTAHYPPIPTQDLKNADVRLGLPASYALYPAVTWPHKNHLRLFDALALLRDRRGIVVNLVCTGARYEPHWPRVQQRLKELELEPQVRFLGFLSETDLRIVYRRSQFLILPTLFEADSCPIHEAWSEDVPVASSCLTALPEQVGDAGLLFNATEVTAIADSIQKMTTDPDLRRDLVERGRRRVKDFDWTRTAKAYRAVYRRAAGLVLNEEDRWLLEWDWMKQPQRAPGMADCYE